MSSDEIDYLMSRRPPRGGRGLKCKWNYVNGILKAVALLAEGVD